MTLRHRSHFSLCGTFHRTTTPPRPQQLPEHPLLLHTVAAFPRTPVSSLPPTLFLLCRLSPGLSFGKAFSSSSHGAPVPHAHTPVEVVGGGLVHHQAFEAGCSIFPSLCPPGAGCPRGAEWVKEERLREREEGNRKTAHSSLPRPWVKECPGYFSSLLL